MKMPQGNKLMKSIHPNIKAACIFSILPGITKTIVQNRLPEKHVKRLNHHLGLVDSLSPAVQKEIFEEFNGRMRDIQQARESRITTGLIASGTIMALLMLGAFVISLAKGWGTDATIGFMELILANGGMHLVLFPYLAEFLYAHYGVSPARLFIPSRQIIVDLVLATATAPFIALAFMLLLPPYATGTTASAGMSGITIFYAVMAITIGPATEELFFRYLMFLRPGEQYGYVFMGVVSSLLFASVHMPDSFPTFLVYCGSGGIFCALAWYRKSLFVSFISHALANALLFLL